MTYDTIRESFDRKPVTIVELVLDFCLNEYGVAPCTAAVGVTGSGKCFNTRVTCQDPTNFDKGTKTFRFCSDYYTPKPSLPMFPAVVGTSVAPTKINPTGFSERAVVTITLQDFPHHDRGVDPYVDSRSYTPEEQGTFFGKLKARNPYVFNRPLKLKTGYISDDGTIDMANFRERLYFIEKIDGPDKNGRVTITAKDVLKFIDNKNAQAPAPNTGVLDGAITDSDTTLTLDDATDYASSGTIRVNDEIITYSGKSSNDLTGLTRGTSGTTAAAHQDGDSVQECLVYSSDTIPDILDDLLQTYAGVDSSYIPKTDWDAEASTFFSSYSLGTVISEPTPVKELIEELIETAQFYIWWDEIDQEIKFKAVVAALPTTSILDVTDANNIIQDSMKVTENDKDRLSQVYVYYNKSNLVEDDSQRFFRNVSVSIDADAETAEKFGVKAVKEIKTRWHSSEAIALEVGSRLLARFRNVPKMLQFELDARDGQLWTGDFVDVTTRNIQTASGLESKERCIVMEAEEVKTGHKFRYKALQFPLGGGAGGRIGLIGPDTLTDYTTESDANKAKYAFISNDAGVMSDGDQGYVII